MMDKLTSDDLDAMDEVIAAFRSKGQEWGPVRFADVKALIDEVRKSRAQLAAEREHGLVESAGRLKEARDFAGTCCVGDLLEAKRRLVDAIDAVSAAHAARRQSAHDGQGASEPGKGEDND